MLDSVWGCCGIRTHNSSTQNQFSTNETKYPQDQASTTLPGCKYYTYTSQFKGLDYKQILFIDQIAFVENYQWWRGDIQSCCWSLNLSKTSQKANSQRKTNFTKHTLISVFQKSLNAGQRARMLRDSNPLNQYPKIVFRVIIRNCRE